MPSDDGMRPQRCAPTPARVRVEGHERLELQEWEVAAIAPDSSTTPAAADAADLDWLAISVPGTAAAALRDAGRWRLGEERDFDREDWWFRTAFSIEPAAANEELILCLGGVATVHEVFLNGELVHSGTSMWEPISLELGSVLRRGENRLAIRCLALAPLLRQRRKPRARWRTRLADNGLRFFRTMLLGRCPGFAPGPAVVGPWRPVWLERRRDLVVEALELRPRIEGNEAALAVSGRLRSLGGEAPSAVDVVVSGAGEAEASLRVRGEADALTVEGELRLTEFARWWPHTHGDPELIDVSVRVASADRTVMVEAGRVGFRELVAGPEPGHDPLLDGLDLHLNGVGVFARGAIWTPLDPVGLAPPREDLRAALVQVREAGMNMLRVPGTSTYESVDFHDLCDELGILVWVDFAFANFDYPVGDDDFLAQVEAEARTQLADLGGRPSLTVLCGNSEVEQQVGMLGLDPALGRNELFAHLLPKFAAAARVDAIYLPSAPCGGDRPFRNDVGIAHYFGVGGYLRPLSDARLAGVRFAAECLAFANVPEGDALEEMLPEGGAAEMAVHHPRWKAGVPRDRGAGWDFDDVRDHYLRELFGVEPGELRRYDPERYLELSREVSGEAMAAVFGEWRRGRSPCGGGLVLWLRDLFPGAGWGVVDSRGVPKRAYEHLRRALAPVAVWFSEEGLNGIDVHLANDLGRTFEGSLRIALYGEGDREVASCERALAIAPHGRLCFDLEDQLGRFLDVSWTYRFGPPTANLIVATLERRGSREGEARIVSQSFAFPAGYPLEQASSAELGLTASATVAGDLIELALRSDRVLYGLRVSAAGYRLGHPVSSLEPGRTTRIALHPTSVESPAGGSISVAALNLRDRISVAAIP